MDVLREILLPKLDGVRMSAGSWMARCPAHEDGRASLHVSRGRDHPVVLTCLAGETRVITRDGTKTLAEMAGGIYELLVPYANAGQVKWQKVPVSAFGIQPLMKITLRRGKAEKIIYATAEHRWFVQKVNHAHGRPGCTREVITAELQPGARLKSITGRRRIEQVCSIGVAHGFTYGDGTMLARGLGSAAHFCGPKDEALLPYFPRMAAGLIKPDCLRMTGLPKFFKRLPPIDEAPAYLYGWLAGYFAADGSIEGPNGPAIITSADRAAVEFVRDVATRLGIVTYPIREQTRRCPLPQGGVVTSTIYKVTLRGIDLTDDFFVIPAHRDRWANRGRPQWGCETWQVVSVEPTDRVEEVYCAIVEGSHAFALEDNILTGNCHAGCERDAILDALGLTWDALCTPREERPGGGEWTPHGDAVAVYDYTDEAGKLLFQVLRTADKQFSQRVPDPSRKSGWRWKLEGTRRVLYRLPKVLEAIAGGGIIWVCEGEKDVHALERAGQVATCNPGGAGKWRPEYAEALREAAVCIVADADKPGRAHARQVAASLEGVAAAAEIVEAAAGKDAADHLAAGKTTGQFIVTDPGVQAAPELAPDLYEFLAQSDPAEEWVIPHLLEHGDRLIWTGKEGLGKTVVTRQIAIAAAAGIHPFTDIIFPPQRVLFIDCENPVRKSRRRFRELETIARFKRRPVPGGGFRIIHRPEAIDLSREEESAWLLERVTAHKPDLLVIGPLYKLHALDINEELAARAIVTVLDQARARADCAVIIEGHAPHGDGDRSRTLRPAGSSLFMRWPEFGYGIAEAPKSDENPKPTRRRVVVRAWRGPRDERDWPYQLRWGAEGREWPWVPVTGEPYLSVVGGTA